jgi:hypothetical protein
MSEDAVQHRMRDSSVMTLQPNAQRCDQPVTPPASSSPAANAAARHLDGLLHSHGGALQIDRLRWIGAGGTHFVYAHPDQHGGGYVLKIKRDPALDDMSGASASDDAARAMLHRYFPPHWLATSYGARVPVVMADAVRRTATVLVQRYDPNFLNGERVTLQNQYLELFPASAVHIRRYRAAAPLLTGPASSGSLRAFIAFNPGLKQIAVLATRDEAFRNMLATLLTGATRLVNETGDIVDLVGHDNVFFHRTAQGWSCRLGDIAKGNRLDRVMVLLRRSPRIADLQDFELGEILNGLAFVRVLNFASFLLHGRAAVVLPLGPEDLRRLRDCFRSGLWLQRLGSHLQALSLGE